MAVIVVVDLTAHPGQAGRVSAQVRALLTLPARSRQRPSVLLQSRTDPERFAYVGEWDSPAHFREHLDGRRGTLDFATIARDVTESFFHSLHLYQRMLEPILAVDCSQLHVPDERVAEVVAHLRGPAADDEARDADPSIRQVAVDVDDPGHLLVYRGWKTQAGLDAYLAGPEPRLATWLRERGVRQQQLDGPVRWSLEARLPNS